MELEGTSLELLASPAAATPTRTITDVVCTPSPMTRKYDNNFLSFNLFVLLLVISILHACISCHSRKRLLELEGAYIEPVACPALSPSDANDWNEKGKAKKLKFVRA